MKNKIYNIFKRCFDFPITEEILFSLIGNKEYETFTKYVNDTLVGFSIVRGNIIILLCVDPDFQKQGFGKELLLKSEEHIKNNGYGEIILGGTDSRLFIGAVSNELEHSQNRNYFFEKYGYNATASCAEMKLSLNEFNFEKYQFSNSSITYEYWHGGDKSQLLEAVGKVVKDWVLIYQHNSPIFVAKVNDQVVGFTVLGFNDTTLLNDGNNIVGSVGCVGVVPEMRKHGIGLTMVTLATNELKLHGCDESFIHYTHIDKWYAKLGYKSFLWYWFGKKQIKLT